MYLIGKDGTVVQKSLMALLEDHERERRRERLRKRNGEAEETEAEKAEIESKRESARVICESPPTIPQRTPKREHDTPKRANGAYHFNLCLQQLYPRSRAARVMFRELHKRFGLYNASGRRVYGIRRKDDDFRHWIYFSWPEVCRWTGLAEASAKRALRKLRADGLFIVELRSRPGDGAVCHFVRQAYVWDGQNIWNEDLSEVLAGVLLLSRMSQRELARQRRNYRRRLRYIGKAYRPCEAHAKLCVEDVVQTAASEPTEALCDIVSEAEEAVANPLSHFFQCEVTKMTSPYDENDPPRDENDLPLKYRRLYLGSVSYKQNNKERYKEAIKHNGARAPSLPALLNRKMQNVEVLSRCSNARVDERFGLVAL